LRLAPGCVYSLSDIYAAALPWRNGLPSITGSVAIDGQGAVIERVACTPNFRFFYVAPGGSLTLRNLTLSQGQAVAGVGSAGAGGAIYSAGNLVMRAVTVTANLVEGGLGTDCGPYTTLPGHPALGGAVFVAGGEADIASCAFSGNVAQGGSSAANVCSSSTPNDCRYSGIAQGAEAPPLSFLESFGLGGLGGVATNPTRVPGAPGGFGGGSGGAGSQSYASNIGGSPHLIGGPGGGGGGGAFGGALFVYSGAVNITNSVFSDNRAVGGLGGLGEGSGCCHSPAGQPGQGLGADIFWFGGSLNLVGTRASVAKSP